MLMNMNMPETKFDQSNMNVRIPIRVRHFPNGCDEDDRLYLLHILYQQ